MIGVAPAVAAGVVIALSLFPASGRGQDSARTGAPVRVAARTVPQTASTPGADSSRSLRDGSRAPTTAAEVRGRVLDAGAELPLPAASLRLEGRGEPLNARSSIDGAFTFPAVAPGTYSLVVARASYRSARLGIVVPPGGALVVDVQLTRLPVALARVVVDAARDDSAGVTIGVVAPATLADAERTPHPMDLLAAQGGTLTALAGEATARRSGDPGSDRDGRTLYIWGAKDAGARVQLDGIPLGAPLHLGGLLPVVDEDLMASPRLWTGGASARHDGGTDYVLDLSTRAAGTDSIRAWAMADLLTARVGGEMPLGENGSILAGARRVDQHSLARAAGVEPGYRYGDLLTRIQLAPAAGQIVRATGFATREGIGIPRDQGQDDAAWENRAGSASWERVAGTGRSLVRAGVSRASIDLPLLTLTDGHLRADAERTTILAEQRWSASRWETSAGLEWESLQVQRSVAGDSIGSVVSAPANQTPCPPGGTCTAASASANVWGATASFYVDHRRLLAPWLRVQGGVRTSAAQGLRGAGRDVVLPRLALEALPFGGTTVRASVGRYSRMATVFDGTVGEATDPASASAPRAENLDGWITRATATQVEIGGTQRWRHALAAVSAFWGNPGITPLGQGGSSTRGIDASWRVEGGVTALQASYTRIVRDFFATAGDSATSAVAASRRVEQLASLQGSARVGRLAANLAASYAHGLSFTPVVLESPAAATKDAVSPGTQTASAGAGNAAPAQHSYLRVDATVSAKWCVGGPACRLLLTPYVRVLNALDRRDAIFYYNDAPGHSTNRLAGIPALLSLGMRIDAAHAAR